jgi:superfamily II DNA or RNA helicase
VPQSAAELSPPAAVDAADAGAVALFGFVPRDYQYEAQGGITGGFDAGAESGCLVMPTGAGKTKTFGMVILLEVDDGGRVLVLAHRGELIDQAVNDLTGMGLEPLIEKADSHACPHFTQVGKGGDRTATLWDDAGAQQHDPKVVVASVQTLQGDRLKAWPPGYFSMIICDECHHATAETYKSIVAHLKPKKYLGVTATPDRGDKSPVIGKGAPFGKKFYEYSLSRAVARGYLAKPVFRLLPCAIDFKDIRTTGGDLNAEDIAAAIRPHIQTLVNEMAPSLVGRRFLVFTPDVGCAEAVATALESLEGYSFSVRAVSGESPDRDEVVARFKAGEFNGLANCQLFTEGSDFPDVDCIVLLRCTTIRSLFVQMIGRGLRKPPGKTSCRVIAFNTRTFKQKLIRPVDLFDDEDAGDVAPDVMDAAQESLDSGESADILAAIKKAQKAAPEKRRIRLEIEAQALKAKTHEYDPLGVEVAAEGKEAPIRFEAKITEKQTAALEKFGWKPKEIVGFSSRVASAVLDKEHTRISKGLASRKQLAVLKRLKYDGNFSAVSFADASEAIGRLKTW